MLTDDCMIFLAVLQIYYLTYFWKAYNVTKPYWSERRALVNEEYKTLPPIPLTDLLREEEHFVDTSSNLASLIGKLFILKITSVNHKI